MSNGVTQVTSSSCSGRIALFCGEAVAGKGDASVSDLITKGGKWLIAAHATITFDQLVTALRSSDAQSSHSNMVRDMQLMLNLMWLFSLQLLTCVRCI